MTQDVQVQQQVHTFSIEVAYNGVTESLTVQPHETVHAALEQAMNLFNIQNQRHLMAFYREDGTEVEPENISLVDAHITPGTLLALRPSRVKGGNG
jgi:hypothetical protein